MVHWSSKARSANSSTLAKKSCSSIPNSWKDFGISSFSFNSFILATNEVTPSSVVLAGKPFFLAKFAYFSSAIKYSYFGKDTNFVGLLALYLITYGSKMAFALPCAV